MKYVTAYLLIAIGLPCFVALIMYVIGRFIPDDPRVTDAMNEEYRDGDGW